MNSASEHVWAISNNTGLEYCIKCYWYKQFVSDTLCSGENVHKELTESE